MKDMKQYIGVDLGAESGRVMLGSVSGNKLTLEEIHRFGNGPVEQNGSIRWDFNKLLSEIKSGIAKAVKHAKGPVAGIGVDSWGLDYGLVDSEGKLLENPYHYRDSRTEGIYEKAFALMKKRDIYQNTGLQFLPFNTVYQLLAARLADSAALSKASKLLFFADLVSYHLCNEIFAEYTLASISQLMDMRTGQWSQEIFDKLSLPLDIMPEIVQAGTVVGKLTEQVASEIGCEQIPVIAIASHDTGSAVVSVPAAGDNWSYCSSGTWTIIGVELSKAVINDQTFSIPFSNEGGVEGTIRLLKNIMGLWLVQECRRQWQREGVDLDYSQLTQMAREARPFVALIDPDHDSFIAPGDMPRRINAYLKQSGQQAIDDKGQMVRVIFESLALKYRWVFEELEKLTTNPFDRLHIVGGGIKNELLCQFTANAIGKEVLTGPVEATAIGNIIMQARATGQVDSLEKAREIVRNSFELKQYKPTDTHIWAEQYQKLPGR